MSLLSIVVPCYNEDKVLLSFYKEIKKTFTQFSASISTELIFINDGSSDDTLATIKKLAEHDNSVRYVSFSRNFGKESAIFAGLSKATGDFVAIMDADMQDPPSLLPKMLDYLILEKYDCVATRRITREGEPPIRSFFAQCFYKIINKISDVKIMSGARDYRIITRRVVNAILSINEYNRFSKGIFNWVGFKTKWIDYKNIKRAAGCTKWSFWKLFLYSLDGIVAFSTAPLYLASVVGTFMCLLAFIFILIIIFKTIIFGEHVAGYPSMMCAIIFIGGIQLFCVGILGQYIAKIYLETKQRPKYLIDEEN